MELVAVLVVSMMTAIGAAAIFLSMMSKPVVMPSGAPEEVREALSGVSIETKREDRLKFRRTYKKQITKNARVKVSARTTMFGDRWFSGEVTQPNGRWVLFDPDRVADKILDPTLVPLIEQFCRDVRRLDREFMASKPSEFVDETGQRWVRASPTKGVQP